MHKIILSPAMIMVAYSLLIFISGAIVICKVIGLIGMSWVWVFAPLWVPSVALFIFTLIGLLFLLKDEKEGERQDALMRSKYQRRA